jgi:hypothetical protein
MFKKYRVGDLFDIHPTNAYKMSNADLYLTEGSTPVLSNSSANNGIGGYSGLEPTEKGGIITFSDTTTGGDTMFFQADDFIGYPHVQGMYPFITDKWDEKCSLYAISTIRKAAGDGWSYAVKFNRALVKELMIELPVIENSNPEHKYTVDDIDWQYMRDRIAELMRDRITELERYRIRALDTYLQVTGLNDYELTEDDKKILSLSAKDTSDEERTLEDNSKDEVRFGEFDISDIYEVQKVQHKLDKSQIESEGNYPCFSSDTTNNGILGYTDNPEFHISDKIKVYIIFGDHTRTFDIATTDFSVLDNVKVLKPVTNNIKALQYINSVWGKSIPNLGYARHWSVAKDRKLLLPIKSDGTPDFDYMERYIRAMEKVVIADVVNICFRSGI